MSFIIIIIIQVNNILEEGVKVLPVVVSNTT